MSRRPADIISAQRYPQDRQAIWAAIRKLHAEDPARGFTRVDVAAGCKANTETVRTYLTGLTRAGFLEVMVDGTNTKSEKGLAVRTRWKLVKDVGVDAPRVTRDGKHVTQGDVRELLWKTMRVIGDFTVRELAASASLPEQVVEFETAKDYVKYLTFAGYIVVTEKGGARKPARYRFIKQSYTGPKAPQIQKIKQVFDPNTGKVVWPVPA